MTKIKTINDEEKQIFDELSNLLVSYWQSKTIYSGVKLGLFEAIGYEGKTIEEIKAECQISGEGASRLVRALCSLRLLKYEKGKVSITNKGQFLKKSHKLSLFVAALMRGEEHYNIWSQTFQAVKEGKEVFSNKYHHLLSHVTYFLLNCYKCV